MGTETKFLFDDSFNQISLKSLKPRMGTETRS